LISEDPEVLDRYRRIREVNEQIGKIELSAEEDTRLVNAEVTRLQELYPSEMGELLQQRR